MPITLTVILKDDSRTYRQKFLLYEPVTLEPSNDLIRQCIKEAKDSFGNDAEDVQIRTSMEI